jgi:hypothetical protein
LLRVLRKRQVLQCATCPVNRPSFLLPGCIRIASKADRKWNESSVQRITQLTCGDVTLNAHAALAQERHEAGGTNLEHPAISSSDP